MSIYIGNKKIAGLYRAEDLTHATEEHAGIIELATQDEVNAGTDDLKAVTPKKVKDAGYVKNTDYATESKGGVIKTNLSLGTAITSQGYLCGGIRTLEQYNSAENRMLMSKGTLENVLNDRIGNIETLLEKLDVGGGI